MGTNWVNRLKSTNRSKSGVVIFQETWVIIMSGDLHGDVIKWNNCPRHWPYVRGIHRSPTNSPHKGQWRAALTFSLICACTNGWVNNRDAGRLRRHRAHYDVTVMTLGHGWVIISHTKLSSWTPYQPLLMLMVFNLFTDFRDNLTVYISVSILFYVQHIETWINVQHFANDIFKCVFLKGNLYWLKFYLSLLLS